MGKRLKWPFAFSRLERGVGICINHPCGYLDGYLQPSTSVFQNWVHPFLPSQTTLDPSLVSSTGTPNSHPAVFSRLAYESKVLFVKSREAVTCCSKSPSVHCISVEDLLNRRERRRAWYHARNCDSGVIPCFRTTRALICGCWEDECHLGM